MQPDVGHTSIAQQALVSTVDQFWDGRKKQQLNVSSVIGPLGTLVSLVPGSAAQQPVDTSVFGGDVSLPSLLGRVEFHGAVVPYSGL